MTGDTTPSVASSHVASSHYEFIRFVLGEPPKDAMWMAIFARRDGLPVPTAEEQKYIAGRWTT